MEPAAYCVIPAAVFGAVIGSFLNVVIFRLPRGLSITRPRWSFCPHCRGRIRPHHNVPILGWLWLRGRCHDCHAPIAAVYPVIECASALLFIMVWDALFIAALVPAIGSPAGDWPMAVAYLALFAGLLVMAGMDIESYVIDIRVSVVMIVAGILCHLAWGIPAEVLEPVGPRPTGALPPGLCLIGAVMGLIWFVTFLVGTRLLNRRGPGDPTNGGGEADAGGEPTAEVEVPTAYNSTAAQTFQPLPIAAFVCVTVGMTAWQMFAPDRAILDRFPAGGERGIISCLLLMLLIILASLVSRASDDQVIEEIEADRHKARPTALREFAWLLPALAVGLVLLVLLRMSGRLDTSWDAAIDALPAPVIFASHAAGASRAVAGMVFAAALGWTVRILGTLAFRKEAFGTGDIYILAAIGAVAGFWAVVFAFFLAAILALVGVLATMFRKSSRAIPFGPWLAMGAFAGLYLQDFFLGWFGAAGSVLWSAVCGRPLWLPGD